MFFKQEIAKAIAACAPAEYADVLDWIEIPPQSDMGDYALPCFKLSKTMRKPPNAIAAQLQSAFVLPNCIERVEAAGGYLNFFVEKQVLAQMALSAVLQQGELYGADTIGNGKNICIDYSSINIAKRFHIGHLSTTMLGNALTRMYRFLGYTVIGINHLGDWGTQFGNMIVALKLWGNREMIESGGIDALTQLYVRFHQEEEHNPELAAQGRAWFKKIEDGDPEAMELFDYFKQITLKETQRIYDLLGVTFDSYAGESFYNDKMDRVIDELRAKDLLKLSDGAYVVDLETYGMPPCIILKSDGATLYATRDIAAALYRHDTYNFDKCLYVVAYQQNLHFQQFFKTLELMGYDWAKRLEHVSYGMVSYEGESLSTRTGHTVYLDDLMEQAIQKALDIINEKNPLLEGKEEIAQKIGIGAAIFFDLSASRIKDIDFRWERALNFDGETGPYLQYTYARCHSVLAKADTTQYGTAFDTAALCDADAQNVLKLLLQFPALIKAAVDKSEPSLIARYLIDLAQGYNKFYYENRILEADATIQQARLQLTKAVQTVLKLGLYLLGIEVLEKM